MDYRIREMQTHEYPILSDFLYEAIFQRDENNLAPRTIVNDPALQIYIEDFGTRADDYCLCADVNCKIIGVIWARNIAGFGSVDSENPELAISLIREYRGQGIGTELLRRMLALLNEKGYQKVSLAVQKDNYALYMYEKAGFETVGENTEEFIMEFIFK